MKILIDFVTNILPEAEKYRDNITQRLISDTNQDITILYRNIRPKFKGEYKSSRVHKGIRNFSFSMKRAFATKVLATQPDIIIGFGAIVSLSAARYPTFLYLDDTNELFLPSKKKRYHKQVKQYDKYVRIVVKTNYQKLFLANNYEIDKEKLVVIKPGYESQFLSKNITDDIRDVRRILTIYRVSQPYLFVFGKVEEYAHIETVIESFSRIHLKYPDLKLLIASPDFKIGWDNKPIPLTKRAAKVFELANQYKVTRKVLFAGIIDREHLPVILSNAEICINLDSRNKFSYSVLETLAAQSPLIIGDSPILKEIAGNAALVASSTVPALLTEKINILLSEEREAQKLTKKAKERIKEYKWKISAEELVVKMEKYIETKPKSDLLILYNKNFEIKELKEILDEKFKVQISEMIIDGDTYMQKVKEFISLIRLIRKYERIVLQQQFLKCRFIILVLFFRIFFPRTKWFLFLSPGFFKQSSQGIKAKILSFIKKFVDTVYLKVSYDKYVVTNPIFENILSDRFMINMNDVFLVELTTQPLPTDLNVSRWKEENKLKNYVPIFAKVSNKREGKNVMNFFDELTEVNSQFKLFLKIEASGDIDIDTSSKRFTIVTEEDQIVALQSSRIYIDFREDPTVEDLLLAMKTKNLCIVASNYSSEYMIKEGINGYIVNTSETGKIVKLVDTLINNKKHLSDIQKINYLKTLDYEKSSIIERTNLFLNNW